MSAVELLVHAIAKARPDWPREDIRAAIADAVARPLHKLTLDRAAAPADLRDFIRRHATEQAAAAIASSAPPIDHALDPAVPAAPPSDAYRQARQELALRRTP